MAKIQLKSDNINPFGGLYSIFNQFDRSGLRSVIDEHLGKRGTTKAASPTATCSRPCSAVTFAAVTALRT